MCGCVSPQRQVTSPATRNTDTAAWACYKDNRPTCPVFEFDTVLPTLRVPAVQCARP